VVQWAKPTADRKIAGMIVVSAGMVNETLEVAADTEAKNFKGTIRKERIMVGGEPAIMIDIPSSPTDAGISPKREVVVRHYGLTCTLFEVAAADPLKSGEEFDAVCKSLRWVPIQGPGKYAEVFRGTWLPLGDHVLFDIPVIMRPTEFTKDHITFVMTRVDTKVPDVTMQLRLVPRDPALTPEQTCDGVAKVGAQMKLQGELKFEKVPGNDAAYSTQFLAWKSEDEEALVGVGAVFGKKKFVMVNFQINTKDPAEQKLLAAACRKIVGKLKFEDSE
jgi:hypothetical protein